MSQEFVSFFPELPPEHQQLQNMLALYANERQPNLLVYDPISGFSFDAKVRVAEDTAPEQIRGAHVMISKYRVDAMEGYEVMVVAKGRRGCSSIYLTTVK